MTAFLNLTAEDIDAVADGCPPPELLDRLRRAQLSKRKLLLTSVWHDARAQATSSVHEAIVLLSSAEQRNPDAVAEIIARPFTNVWAIACPRDPAHSGPHLEFLKAMAAAGAIHAGLAFDLPLSSRDGEVFLPGLGTAQVGAGPCRVRSDGEKTYVIGPEATVTVGQGERWLTTRRIELDGRYLTLEDQDPYRDCFGYRLAGKLTDPEWAAAEDLLARTFRLLDQDHAGYASVIRLSLRALVPLAVGSHGRADISASTQEAYGSVAAALPRDAATLALLLIHEIRHMMLGAVLDLVQLCVNGGEARHHAPWRMDPRPAQALLQGAFAHVGVTDFWRIHRHRPGGDQRRADFEFAYWRAMTSAAVETLSASGELTPAGARFVDRMAAVVDAWRGECVSADVADAVDDLCQTTGVMWRLRNHTPAVRTVEDLGQRWRNGASCPPLEPPVVAAAAPRPASHDGLSALIRRRLFGELEPAGAAAGDQAYLDADYEAAAAAYQQMIGEPDPPVAGVRSDDETVDDGAWVGLAASLRRLGAGPAADQLVRRPDLVRALYLDNVRAGLRPDPPALAAWLATAPDNPGPGSRGRGLNVAVDSLSG